MDIESLPSNSDASKKAAAQKEKKVEGVVTGSTSLVKKSKATKLLDVFRPEDVRQVGIDILTTILIPKVQTLIHDVGSEAWDTYWGIPRTKSSDLPASKYKFLDYSSISTRPIKSTDTRSKFTTYDELDYDLVSYSSQNDALRVLDGMDDLCARFHRASVADLYELSRIPTTNWMLDKFGWTSMRDAKIEMFSGGRWKIILPKAIRLDD